MLVFCYPKEEKKLRPADVDTDMHYIRWHRAAAQLADAVGDGIQHVYTRCIDTDRVLEVHKRAYR